MPEDKKHRLFVYGTLTNPGNVRTIAGRTFPSRKAILEGFEKVSSTQFFPYITRRRGGLVQGLLLEELDEETVRQFDQFEGEGDLYRREKVMVSAGGESLTAYTYVGNKRNLLKYFDRGVALEDRIQDHLEDRMENILEEEEGLRGAEAQVERRASAELHGSTISDLVAAHFDYAGIPDYLVRKGLKSDEMPTLEGVASNEKILKYADNYIQLAVKHIVFNQLEQRIRREFRGLVKGTVAMYEYTISCLLALKQINRHQRRLSNFLSKLNANEFHRDMNYMDYAVAGIKAADFIYSRREISDLFIRILSHRQEGRTPLGAEIEMSLLGYNAIDADEGKDSEFDSFYYFNDFDLPRRCWKLGGYVDDHSIYSPLSRRSRGFFEYAFGRLNLEGNIAKPATQDPWILSELINEALKFTGIPPHSMHLTLQPPSDTEYRVLKEPEYLLCLLMMGGDLSWDGKKVLREKRIWQQEVVGKNVPMSFSKFNYHPSTRTEEDTEHTRLVEYQFQRLRQEPHEAAIMTIKGFQLGYKPYPFITSPHGQMHEGYEEMSRYLIEWAKSPGPVGESAIGEFLQWTKKGLMEEDKGYPSHSRRFIEDCLKVTEDKLKEANLRLAQSVMSKYRVVGSRPKIPRANR